MSALRFEILHRDEHSHARVGHVTTPHGTFDTPAFMPVGTQGTIKGLLPDLIEDVGAQVILANTYHLMLRPGAALIAELGGLHRWSRWERPILTDSGGYQVFSLADINRIDEHGVTFRSHLNGDLIELTPRRSIRVQNELGADIIMAFDDCPPANEAGGRSPKTKLGKPTPSPAAPPSDYPRRVQSACERTVRWLGECVAAHERADEQALFGIVQGGIDLARRDWCLERVCQHDLPGFAIGGVAVGEGYEGLRQVVEHVGPRLPADRPRYLMGVGYERDIITAVRAGIDMFDCVLPTRNGRNGNAFTTTGQIRLRNARFTRDPGPIDPACDCPACAGGYSRSYLRHLFLAGEMLGPILTSIHNLRHFQRLLLDIRGVIADNGWSRVRGRWGSDL